MKKVFLPVLFGGAIGGIAQASGEVAAATIEANAARDAQEALQRQQQDAVAANAATRERLVSDARENLADLFGTTPDQINLADEQIEAALTNLNNLPQINQVVQGFNDAQVNQDINRALQFDPNFRSNLSALSDQARSFIRGEIPEDVLDSTIRSRAGFTGVNGVPGTSQEATARDLALTSLDLQDRGQSIFQQIGNIRDQASPIDRTITGSQFLLDPAGFIAVQEANNNLASSPTPGLAELLGVELQGSANDAAALAGVAVPTTSVGATGLSTAARSFGELFNDDDFTGSFGSLFSF